MQRLFLGLCATAASALLLSTVPSFASNAGDGETLAVQAAAQSAFERAFWLEEHEGDLVAAQAQYEALAADTKADAGVRAEARHRARALAQDLLADDLAQLLPADGMAFATLSAPGEHISAILESLGLLGRASETGAFGVSPDLVQSLFGAKGAALAITRMGGPNGLPGGVLVLHPGSLDSVRGLIETALPARARQGAKLDGYPTWEVEAQPGLFLHVAFTESLVIASNDRLEIGAVIERMNGDDPDSLATNAELARALEGRQHDLLTVCVNAHAFLPMLRPLAEQAAAHDPRAAMALDLVDLDSFRSVSAHLGAGDLNGGGRGLGLSIDVDLAEGHKNLVFDLLHLPHVDKQTLAGVPAGAAFALLSAFNPEGEVPALPQDAKGRSIVSLLDVGREVFANLIDAAVFGLPGEELGAQGLPSVALVLRSRDAERTRSILDLALSLAAHASEGRTATESVAGIDVGRFELNGVPILLAAERGRVIVTPSREALARAIDAANGRDTLADDPGFAADLAALTGGETLALLANPGRCAEMAAGFAPRAEQDQLQAMGALFGDASLCVGLVHDDTRLGLCASVRHLPDVSGLVSAALRGEDPIAYLRAADGPDAGSTVRAEPTAETVPSRP